MATRCIWPPDISVGCLCSWLPRPTFCSASVARRRRSAPDTPEMVSASSTLASTVWFKNRYHGTARIGIEAMELRVRGYSCADIAKLYQKKPNYIGACISRAAEKLRRERIVREFYTACTEQDIKSA